MKLKLSSVDEKHVSTVDMLFMNECAKEGRIVR